MSEAPLVPERLHDLAPGRKLVYLAIQRNAPAHTNDIVAQTGLSAVSVRNAVLDLEARGEITVLPTLGDARRRQYKPDPPPR